MAVRDRLASARTRHGARAEREKDRRCMGATAWLGVRAVGAVVACPLAGVAHTRACTQWQSGAACER
jgi:hypothetical protein